MSFLLEFLLILIVGLGCFYKWIIRKYDFFDVRNIPYEKPFLCFGNFKGMFFRTESMFLKIIDLHNSFNAKVYGVFEISNPLIVLKDPELIKQITVKDFDHFVNHRVIIENEDDKLFGNTLFVMKDQKWKDMRATLSPAFTGSKMRVMFQLISECCEDAVKYLKTEANKSQDGCLVMDMKDYFTRYTNDVIASSAFGLKVNSLVEQNNEFYEMGKKITNFSGWLMIKFFLFSNFRTVMRFFKVKLFDAKFSDFFMRLVLDSMKYRTAHNIVRPDMISMLMEAQKSTEKSNGRNWSDHDIVAQCFLFFVAGFETTATMMCFAAHELMENPETQEKLLSEIEEVKEKLAGEPLTYEDLKGMKYLEMVMSETMRKWPAAVATDRVCTKPYTLKYDENVVNLNVGDVMWINIAGMHYDPETFPNPEKFDPERFSEENKGSINPYLYAPFGLGPRNCIGNRFALMEAKAILFHILSNFSLEASEKTSIPLELTKDAFQLKPVNGFWLKLRPKN